MLLLLRKDIQPVYRKHAVRQHALAEHRHQDSPRAWCTWKTRENPLCWSETTVSTLSIGSSQASAENHVHHLSARSVRVYDDFCHHIFEHVSSSFNSTDLFWCFLTSMSDRHTVLGKNVAEHASVVCPSVTSNNFWPASPMGPAMHRSLQTRLKIWRTEELGFPYNSILIVHGSPM